jgi:SAM-dependent methyltransferase
VANLYDQVRYPGLPLAQTHPDRLATVAGLFGLAPATPARCRVLEIGCGDGGNLIPMALALPRSEFTGIDRAERAVAQGRSVAAALGLSNIMLRQLDLMQAHRELGEFDYIIAHGIYSWVPPEVREGLLRLCRASLAPQGVAYVSYNAYPGFHRREMFREMLLYHLRDIEDPDDRVRQARELIESLTRGQSEGQPARVLFDEEVRHLSESEAWYLYHDDLAPTNHALYFHEFIAHARRQALEYLAEANFFEMQDDIYPGPVTEMLRRLAGGDVVHREQYLDFVKGRCFRQTLLCRDEAVLDRSPRPERITGLYVASEARSVTPEVELRSEVLEEFRGPRGSALRTDSSEARAALRRLREMWPRSVPFEELAAAAGGDAARLAEILFDGYCAGLLELHSEPLRLATSAGWHPVASPLARLQAQHGSLLTTLRHTTVEIEDVASRYLVLMLDGTRDRGALLDGLRVFVRSRATGDLNSITAESVELSLAQLAEQALLLE